MNRLLSRVLFLAIIAGNVHGSCGGSGCPPMSTPVPMTEARARQLQPGIETGLALSATHVYGDCRPLDAPAEGSSDSCEAIDRPACARERGPLRIFILTVNQSVPADPECKDGFRVDDLARLATVDRNASEEGELVEALEASHYTVYVSADNRCASCGFEAADNACRVEVSTGHVTARDLIIDEATH